MLVGKESAEFKNAHKYKDLYEGYDFTVNTLGCLMLNTDVPYAGTLPTENQYFSNDPSCFWMNGVAKDWHVTIRYGFLPYVSVSRVQEVLRTVPRIPHTLKIEGIEVFPSTGKEPYECVVARVSSEWLDFVNQQLSVLPNVNTFPVYKPHITIGYFDKGTYSGGNNPYDRNYHLEGLEERLPKSVPTFDYNFGKMPLI